MHRGFKGFPGGPGFYGRGFEGGFLERGFGFHWIEFVAVVALILIAGLIIYFLVKRYMINNNIALEMLNKRFVTGEITEEEYLRKKELILGRKIKKAYKEIKKEKAEEIVKDELKTETENEKKE